MATLYEMTNEYIQVLEMAEDPDVDEQVIADTLDAIGGAIEEKADGYAKLIREMMARREAIKKEESRLSMMGTTIDNRIMFLKEHLETAMIVTGKTKFKTDLFSYSIQKNPPKVVIDDETKIPKGYWIPQQPKLDKDSLKKFLQSGEKCDYAHLEQTEGVRIR